MGFAGRAGDGRAPASSALSAGRAVRSSAMRLGSGLLDDLHFFDARVLLAHQRDCRVQHGLEEVVELISVCIRLAQWRAKILLASNTTVTGRG